MNQDQAKIAELENEILNNIIPARKSEDFSWEKMLDQGCGFTLGEIDSGELEIKMVVFGVEGSVWLSKETWESIGERMGWL
jgi:hypothetical protein